MFVVFNSLSSSTNTTNNLISIKKCLNDRNQTHVCINGYRKRCRTKFVLTTNESEQSLTSKTFSFPFAAFPHVSSVYHQSLTQKAYKQSDGQITCHVAKRMTSDGEQADDDHPGISRFAPCSHVIMSQRVQRKKRRKKKD